jgi:hypothetical protein
MKLIRNIHENVLLNVEQAQKKQGKTYATRKGKQTFEGLVTGETMVKMKKLGKKKALTSSWEPHTNSLDMQVGMGTLILKKATNYPSLKMLIDINGKDHTRTFKCIMFYMINEAEGLNFLRNGRVTYVTK